jgi:hypothetical protein
MRETLLFRLLFNICESLQASSFTSTGYCAAGTGSVSGVASADLTAGYHGWYSNPDPRFAATDYCE